MADLIVSFARAHGTPPLLEANSIRTEILEIAAAVTEAVVTELAARKTDNCIDLCAGADCWVAIGADPDAGNPSDSQFQSSFKMKSGERLQIWAEYPSKVSVVAAS